MFERLRNRIILIFTLISLVFFGFVAYVIYNKSKNVISKNFEIFLFKEVDELSLLIKDQEERFYKDLLYKLKIINYLLYDKPFSIDTTITVQRNGLDILTNQINPIQLHPLIFENNWLNNNVVKYFKVFANAYVAILQKVEEGYLVVASDFPPFQQLAGANYYFPNKTDLAYYISNKNFYIHKMELFGKTYQIGVIPIYIKDQVAGAIMLIIEKWFSPDFQTYFESKIYFKNGYPVLIDEQGNLLLHPTLHGENIKNSSIFYKMYINRSADRVVKLEYIWPENKSGYKKIIYYKYLPQYGYYVGITIFKSDFEGYYQILKSSFFIGAVGSAFYVLIILIGYYIFLVKRLRIIREKLEKITIGEIPEIITDKTGITVEIEQQFNKLISHLKQIEKVTEALSKGKFDVDITPLSPRDAISYNLITLKENLIRAKQEEEKHRKEEEIRSWRNKGVELFIDILSLRSEDLKKWTFEVIKTAVEYVGAFQGGFFILEKEEDGNEYFNLISCYAFNEEKILRRKIPVNTGLFAKIYKDPKLLYIEELPEDYLVITTALGEVKPNALVVVPLVFNNQLIGALEIDSFQKLEKYKLDFLEEIAGHISSSLSSWKVTQETKKLLERSQKQTQQIEQQRKRLEEQVKELEELKHKYADLTHEFKSINNLIDNIVLRFETDPKGKILHVNSLVVSTFRKNYDYFIGKSIRDFLGLDLLEDEHKQKWQDILKGKLIKITESIKIDTEEGEQTIWLTEYFSVIYNSEGNPVKVVIFAIDITEVKVLEHQLRVQVREISKETRLLRKEERRLRKEREAFEKEKAQFQFLLQIYDQTVGRLVINKIQVIIDANEYASILLGYSKEELQKFYLSELVVISEKSRLEEVIEATLKGEKMVETFNFVRKDGNSIRLTAYFFLKESDKKAEPEIYILLTK